MDNLNLNKHISGQFNAELEYIRTQVMTMGGLVEQQLSDAITAMHNQDSDLAKRVIDGDKQVNMMEVAIDEACVRIIAKRQPTASDLRLVMAIIKTIAELERIGDVADKICRTALEKFSQQHQPLAAGIPIELQQPPGVGGGAVEVGGDHQFHEKNSFRWRICLILPALEEKGKLFLPLTPVPAAQDPAAGSLPASPPPH